MLLCYGDEFRLAPPAGVRDHAIRCSSTDGGYGLGGSTHLASAASRVGDLWLIGCLRLYGLLQLTLPVYYCRGGSNHNTAAIAPTSTGRVSHVDGLHRRTSGPKGRANATGQSKCRFRQSDSGTL
ncbi:hypothetical protein GUJ93_ZPchr0006g41566 [Zizania palustris]|uniref:Uncharacterized protein n=1 Tax=Zizania palustris TaxID=103762 RepID=A0A8J5SZI7_ZIZPA|nr:hypothetical protein GUJ93_ZPchr0006g41566 [Zizania palustris]